MYRAFVPLKQMARNIADDLEAFPAWLVSFDGQRFIEVREKPTRENATLLRSLWSVTVDGPARKRRRQGGFILPESISRESILKLAEAIEEIPETQADTVKKMTDILTKGDY